MKLLITTPSLQVPHGGTRVLNDWATGLSAYHDVTLLVNSGATHCPWYELPPTVRISNDIYEKEIVRADIVILGSPHAIPMGSLIDTKRQRGFIFLQMLEHLFNDRALFHEKCMHTYLSKLPMLSISKWNMEYLEAFGRTAPTYYIGNGINTAHFPITQGKSLDTTKPPVVLVEGWESNNPTKDKDNIAAKVAKRLRAEGCHIIAYSQQPLQTLADVPHEYYERPTLAQLNTLYERATILIKASLYDARSMAPLEAMTKGTPTVRAIILGDDDLTDGINCLRGGYDAVQLYQNASRLLHDARLYHTLSQGCINHISQNTLDHWMPRINDLLIS